MSAPAKTASKAAVNLLSRSRIKNRNRSARSSRSMSRLRACWVTQAPVGMGGDPGDVHAAAPVLDHDEDVEAAQEDRVDVGEVDREDRVGLRGQELSPGRPGPSGSGIDARGLQDRPHGRCGYRMAEADQLALNPSVAPAGILAGHPQHQGPDRLWGGWAAWSSARVGPVASNEVGVPTQQGSGRHQPQLAQRGREQLAQRAEHGAIEPGHPRAGVASTQHGDLVTQHQDLDSLRRRSERAAPASSARG